MLSELESMRVDPIWSSHGVTIEMGVEDLLSGRVVATSAVAFPNTDSSLAYIGLSILMGYEAVSACTRLTNMPRAARNMTMRAREKSLDLDKAICQLFWNLRTLARNMIFSPLSSMQEA